MPRNNGTATSPFTDNSERERQVIEAAVLHGRVARSPFAGPAASEPEPRKDAEPEPLPAITTRHHPPVEDDQRRRRNTR